LFVFLTRTWNINGEEGLAGLVVPDAAKRNSGIQ
jgi:hypothetical protein